MSKYLKDLTDQLEHLMYGHNYEVTLGIDSLGKCAGLEDVKSKIIEKHPDARANDVTPVPCSLDDFWEEINFALNYRGDHTAGLTIPADKLGDFEKLQAEYKNYIKEHISETTRTFFYPDDKGIPGYAVFWEFRFILMNENEQSLFLYGASSD